MSLVFNNFRTFKMFCITYTSIEFYFKKPKLKISFFSEAEIRGKEGQNVTFPCADFNSSKNFIEFVFIKFQRNNNLEHVTFIHKSVCFNIYIFFFKNYSFHLLVLSYSK